MDPQDLKDSAKAFEYLKQNRNAFIKEYIKDEAVDSKESPISVFMAGSPGAGKTEFSRRLLENFTNKPIIIDADEIRKFFPGYIGGNSHVFQKAADKGVNLLYDYALGHGLNMLLDGTFAYGGAMENINRSLIKGRKVFIYYIYQDPEIAWMFTQKREELEHRKVTLGLFIHCFVEAKANVIKAKNTFGDKISLNLVYKNLDTNIEKVFENVGGIDEQVFKSYTVENLKEKLKYNE